MKKKESRAMDRQGRVLLPCHIRKAIGLHEGSLLEIELDDSGTILLHPEIERCAICGESVEEQPRVEMLSHGKVVCANCALQISTKREE